MLKQNLKRLRSLLPSIEPIVLAMLVIGAASLWGFIKIADEVFEGETRSFDTWALRILRDQTNPSDPIGPHWLEDVAKDLSALGGLAFTTIATAGIAFYLLIDGNARMATFLIAATASGGILGMLLKAYFARPRPELVPHLSQTFSSSFPSGHSLIAAVVYLTLAALVSSVVSNPWLKLYLLAVGVLITVAVGATRVFLGVHYPTDVLAGWLAGLVWALICWLVARRLQLRGKVENAGGTAHSRQR